MKSLVLAFLAAAALAPGLAGGQPDRPTLDHPSAFNTLTEQLSEVSARIDHRQADGRLAKQAAEEARREVNDIAAELDDERLQGGGQLGERDRFALQERIHQLVVKIDGESAAGPPRP
jgi:hypothetical protein